MSILTIEDEQVNQQQKLRADTPHKLEVTMVNRKEGYPLLKLCISLPVVTRFRCPPEMPLNISSPTIVSAHISNPNIYNTRCINVEQWTRKLWQLNVKVVSQIPSIYSQRSHQLPVLALNKPEQDQQKSKLCPQLLCKLSLKIEPKSSDILDLSKIVKPCLHECIDIGIRLDISHLLPP